MFTIFPAKKCCPYKPRNEYPGLIPSMKVATQQEIARPPHRKTATVFENMCTNNFFFILS